MENKQEIVVYDENGAIVSCEFERVNFNMPTSILSYCDEIKEEIGKILDTTAQMSVSTEEIQIDDKLISNITSFDEQLDESEKKKSKDEKLPVIVRKAKKFLKSFSKEEEIEATYKGRYEEYCHIIEEVCHAVESQKQASINEIQLRNSIINELTPLIEQLEEMVKVGKIDKATFDEQIAKLKELPTDLDREYEIQYKSQLSEIFAGKLNELEKAVVLYKEQIQTYRLQQRTDMEIVMNADSYMRDSAPILKAQGSVMVFNRQQENRLDTMASLNDATNIAIRKNAQDLANNAQAAVELSLNKGVSVDTLSALDASVKKGVEVFKASRSKAISKIEKENQALANLHSSLEEYHNEVLQLVDNNEVIAEILKTSSSSKVASKKLGTNKGNKK